MIERYPNGILHGDVTGEIMAACAALPVVAWVAGYGYLVPDAVGFTDDVAAAGRWRLAVAYIEIAKLGLDAHAYVYQPVDYVALDFALPPSTNGLFVKAPNPKTPDKRIKTRAYKAWLEAAGWAVKPQLTAQGAPAQPMDPLFGEHWAIWIRVNIDHHGDVTNRIKALEDFLVSWKITCGDQWNDRCTVERDRQLEVDCRVIIYQKV